MPTITPSLGLIACNVSRNARSTHFGIAISGNLAGQRTTETMGTLRYMAPEQMAETASWIAYRSNIYGLGLVLYELLTGERPFAATDTVDLRNAVLTGQPTPPRRINPTIPIALERACLKAMAMEPGDRYATATEFAVTLRAVSKRRRSRWLLTGLTLITLIAGLVFGLWKWQEPPTNTHAQSVTATEGKLSPRGGDTQKAFAKKQAAQEQAEQAAAKAKAARDKAERIAAEAKAAHEKAEREKPTIDKKTAQGRGDH